MVRPDRGLTRCLIVAAALLAWVPTVPGRADPLPETTAGCGGGHFYENQNNRTAVVTVQVFNGCSGLAETVDIHLFAPSGDGEIVSEVRERETRAVTFRVPRGGVVQVRGPVGSGELKSSFSVLVR
jgi:hypothetical protein